MKTTLKTTSEIDKTIKELLAEFKKPVPPPSYIFNSKPLMSSKKRK